MREGGGSAFIGSRGGMRGGACPSRWGCEGGCVCMCMHNSNQNLYRPTKHDFWTSVTFTVADFKVLRFWIGNLGTDQLPSLPSE